jgi:hypothetical protein
MPPRRANERRAAYAGRDRGVPSTTCILDAQSVRPTNYETQPQGQRVGVNMLTCHVQYTHKFYSTVQTVFYNAPRRQRVIRSD